MGYVKISIQGYYIERFINMCISKNIFLWGVNQEKSTYAHANIGIKDFKKLKEISQKTKCKIKLEERCGIPFLINKYRKRKLFFIFILIIAIFIYGESKFVWNIEVTGIERIQKDEIIQELAENGLKIGTLKYKVNTKEIINKIRLKRDDIAWMNIDLRRNECNCKSKRNNRKAKYYRPK